MSTLTDKLPSETEAETLVENARESNSGMDTLLRKYELLVHVNAHKWKRLTPTEVEDLYQEGFLGLMRAAKTYDPQFNTKFTTWATCCIEGAIRTSINKERKHQHTSLSSMVADGLEIEGLVADAPVVSGTEETLSTVGRRMKFGELMTRRELDLIRIRYNLEV